MRVIVVVLFVCVLLPIAAFGQGAPPPAAPQMRLEPRPCPVMALRFLRPAIVPSLAKSLNLTEDQVSEVNGLLAKADEAVKPKIEEQRNAAKEFATAMADPNAGQPAVVSAFEKAMKAETAIGGELIKTLFAIRALLTDQQKPDFNKMIEMRTDPWRREMGMFAPGGPAPMTPTAPTTPAAPPPPPPIAPPPTK